MHGNVRGKVHYNLLHIQKMVNLKKKITFKHKEEREKNSCKL